MFKLGKQGKLKCSLITDESQVYEVEWHKNGNKLKPSKKYTINQNELTIENLSSNDSGKYECHLSADKLKTTKSIFINVLGI